MNKKSGLMLCLILSVLITGVVSAAWWNPSTWGKSPEFSPDSCPTCGYRPVGYPTGNCTDSDNGTDSSIAGVVSIDYKYGKMYFYDRCISYGKKINFKFDKRMHNMPRDGLSFSQSITEYYCENGQMKSVVLSSAELGVGYCKEEVIEFNGAIRVASRWAKLPEESPNTTKCFSVVSGKGESLGRAILDDSGFWKTNKCKKSKGSNNFLNYSCNSETGIITSQLTECSNEEQCSPLIGCYSSCMEDSDPSNDPTIPGVISGLARKGDVVYKDWTNGNSSTLIAIKKATPMNNGGFMPYEWKDYCVDENKVAQYKCTRGSVGSAAGSVICTEGTSCVIDDKTGAGYCGVEEQVIQTQQENIDITLSSKLDTLKNKVSSLNESQRAELEALLTRLLQ